VEHLLRDVKDTTISTLATEVIFFTHNLNISSSSFLMFIQIMIVALKTKCEEHILRKLKLFVNCISGHCETYCSEGIGCTTSGDPDLP